MLSLLLRSGAPSHTFKATSTKTLPVLGRRGMSSGSDGAVASDKDWSKREKAAEGRYAREQEVIKLKKLREQIETQEHDLEVDLKEATDVIDRTILEKQKGEVKK